MSCCIIRKVPFQTGNRIVWGLVLSERDGAALLVLPRLEDGKAHSLAVGVEGSNGIFEPADMSRFPFEHGDLENVGGKMLALAEELDEEAFQRYLRSTGDEWWKDM